MIVKIRLSRARSVSMQPFLPTILIQHQRPDNPYMLKMNGIQHTTNGIKSTVTIPRISHLLEARICCLSACVSWYQPFCRCWSRHTIANMIQMMIKFSIQNVTNSRYPNAWHADNQPVPSLMDTWRSSSIT